jgi:hypothetical protein
MRVKVAKTVFAASIVTSQEGLVPAQAPDQPANVDVESGVAVSVTVVPALKGAPQLAPQSMPAGVELTIPSPLPDFVIASSCRRRAKVGATTFAASIVTSQERLVPEHAPNQLVNVDAESGTAVRVTVVPKSKDALQPPPAASIAETQSMPAGVDVMVPRPLPLDRTTVSGCGGFPKIAVTRLAASIVTVQAPVPSHAPDQPAKTEPASATAVSETAVPTS